MYIKTIIYMGRKWIHFWRGKLNLYICWDAIIRTHIFINEKFSLVNNFKCRFAKYYTDIINIASMHQHRYHTCVYTYYILCKCYTHQKLYRTLKKVEITFPFPTCFSNILDSNSFMIYNSFFCRIFQKHSSAIKLKYLSAVILKLKFAIGRYT